ncbi:sialate O-acetylesterase [Chitinophaga cymbidii]|uniref:9-O-acetylesterase n=1 Tax=Chitinophaga cymbidii TaxID=1096750 RepID=A0A512RG15_9BACT|nr:sialate O-acetylesterase [Chitinophaga cymbidii]GEP94594.1 9-O-acetylesterase [Chitinophaga cymbidii]
MQYRPLAILAGLFFGTNAAGQVALPSLFADNMILQQRSSPAIWGKAAAGATVKVVPSWNKKTYTAVAAKDSTWKLFMDTPAAGGPYTIAISSGKQQRVLKNILLGEVWLCSGQSNMEMPVRGATNQPVLHANDILMDGDDPEIRLFKVERTASSTSQYDCNGTWHESSGQVLRYFSAAGYLYARLLHNKLKVPVGMIAAYWGGTKIQPWMPHESLEAFGIPVPDTASGPNGPRRSAAWLYQGMIAPLAGFGIRGFLWYQGEANINEPALYRELLPAMVKGWRQQWKDSSLAFYYVQLAPYAYNGEDSLSSAYLREAQLQSLRSITNSGMAVTLDVGERTCIHPADKYTVAKRLAWLALNKTYGFKGVSCDGPVYASHTVKDGKMLLLFKNAENGITSYYKPVTSFEIAGADKKFYPAQALITKEKGITVWSDKVKEPVAVRYGFRNWVQGELYSNEGLPLSSFRTDNW